VAVYAKHENEIAVVLTDMMMPIMDGPATINALRRINPTVKIIAASGLIIDNKRLLWSSHVLSRSLQQVREGKSQLSKIEVPTGLRLRARAEGQEMEIASARDISVFMKTAKEAITLHAEGYGGHRDGKLVIKGVVIRRFSSINNRNSSKLSQPDGPMADAHMRGLASEYAASVTPHGNH
jgi:CheY-like chemotaxis protein